MYNAPRAKFVLVLNARAHCMWTGCGNANEIIFHVRSNSIYIILPYHFNCRTLYSCNTAFNRVMPLYDDEWRSVAEFLCLNAKMFIGNADGQIRRHLAETTRRPRDTHIRTSALSQCIVSMVVTISVCAGRLR